MSYPLRHSGSRNNKGIDMKLNEQMELGINRGCVGARRPRRSTSATWWFSQMRRAVDASGHCGAEQETGTTRNNQTTSTINLGRN